MKYHVLTLFPEMIQNGMSTSITGRALEKGLIELNTVNIRDYSDNKHMKVDDYPYGGGAGMVMQAEPVFRAYCSILENGKKTQGTEVTEVTDKIEGTDNIERADKVPRVIYLTPQGNVFNQSIAEELSKEKELVFLCGHYEGIDERVLETIVTDNISIGDYVLTGGELPAMVMMDTISRLVPGVLSNDVSAETESFQDNLLEYPQYSRPEIWRETPVPPVLLSGHHKNIETWRREQSLIRTMERRPDLFERVQLTKKDIKFLKDYHSNNE